MAALQANLSDLAPTLDFSSFDMSDGYIETALKVIGFFIPSPTTVAYAIYFCRGYDSDDRINVNVAFSEASTLDRVVFARAYGRRAACRVKTCKILSLSVSGYCYQHAKSSFVKEMMVRSASEEQPEGVKLIQFIRSELEKDSKAEILLYNELPVKRQDIADVKAIMLTEMASHLASKVEYEINPANLAKAKTLLAGNTAALALEDIELSQLYDQFLRLDIDNTGVIDVDDLRLLIASINPKFKTYIPKLQETHLADVLHSVTFGKTVIDSITFSIYVTELLLHREREKDPNQPREFIQTPFWDLRQAILFKPATSTSNNGWMLKKRNRVSSVTWSKRYFRFTYTKPEPIKPGKAPKEGEKLPPFVPEECLEFWELPTNVDPSFIDSEQVHLKGKAVLKGILLLSSVVGVHFDSLIQLPENTLLDPYEYVGFRVNLRHARSYVFVTEKMQAVEWVAKLCHYANANNLKDEWVTDWSLHETEETVTTRDLMYAAAAIVKLGFIKKALLAKDALMALPADKMSNEDKAKKIRALAVKAKQFEHQTYDTEALAICGITDEHTLDQAGGIVLAAMGLFEASKMQLKMFDSSVCFGAFGYTYLAIKTALQIDAYIKDVRFNLKTTKFQVSFDPKFTIRRCSNPSCIYLFKTVSFNVEYKKHHCRACGLVVCHACSTTRLYFDATRSFERVCDMCLCRRGPPEERLLNSAKSPKVTSGKSPQSPTKQAMKALKEATSDSDVEVVTRSSIMRPSINAGTLLAMQPKIKAVPKTKRSSIGDIKLEARETFSQFYDAILDD